MAKVIITLNVNTAGLTPENVDAECSFTDSIKSPETKKPEAFKTGLKMKDTIVWKGYSTDKASKDSVAITDVIFEEGTDLLGQKKIKGKRKKVIGRIKNGLSGDQEKYTVNFDVTRNGKTKSYSIDPILQIDN